MSSYDKGKQVDVAILYFSKAFDTVPHDKILHKLNPYGVRDHIHSWLTSFLTKRKMRVVLEGEKSSEVTVDSGVPHGTILCPILFVVTCDELPD